MPVHYISLVVQGPSGCEEILNRIKSQIDLSSLGPLGDPAHYVAAADRLVRPTRASFSFFLESDEPAPK